jgi:signal transduction histidine kinase
VYGVSPDPARLAFAFDVDVTQLTPYLERALEASPLLPHAQTKEDGERGGPVSLELRDSWGRRIFRSGGALEPEFGFSQRFSGPSAGVFNGMSLSASVSRAAANRLVAGGLPRSRLPLLLGTLALAAGLLIAAVLLSRRERALARMQSDFVSGVSHELRTPLAQIRLFAETLLRDRVRSEEERRRSLAIIDQEARRLSHLVENLLEFSRGQRHPFTLAVENQELEPLVNETVESFRPLAQARSARLIVDLAPAAARVDPDAIRQVVLNLLDNAVRYGPAGQEIRIVLSRTDQAAVLSVEDQGPGIPPEERSMIWRKFARLERDRGTHRVGTGIGLAVVRDLVELHGGRAWVEEGAGGGAKFYIRLPSAAPP